MAICYVFSQYLKGVIESSVEISPYAWNFRIVSVNQVLYRQMAIEFCIIVEEAGKKIEAVRVPYL